MSSKKAQLNCAICGKRTGFFDEPLGPFCSERCKMIDLGKWLGEDYKISEPLRPDHLAVYEELEGELDTDRTDPYR